MKTQFRKATPDDAQKVWHIVWHTKNAIYPDYYTRAVVEYIDRYYTFDIIKNDLEPLKKAIQFFKDQLFPEAKNNNIMSNPLKRNCQ